MLYCSRHTRVITRFRERKGCLILLRLVFLIAHAILFFLNIFYRGFRQWIINVARFLSYWGLSLNMIYFTLTVCTPSYVRPLKGFIAKMNHFVFGLNCMITLVYFAVADPALAADDTELFLSVVNHIVPFAANLVEFSFNNHVFSYRNLVFFVVLFPVYIYVNILFSVLQGNAVYEQVDFRTTEGLFWSFVVLLVCLFGAVLGVWYQSLVKPWLFDYVYLASDHAGQVSADSARLKDAPQVRVVTN